MAKEKAARKAHEKDARKRRKQERRSEMGELMAAMTEEEREETRKRHLVWMEECSSRREEYGRIVCVGGCVWTPGVEGRM
eukprot:199304-Chlamydomonas_euryale.AAC.1